MKARYDGSYVGHLPYASLVLDASDVHYFFFESKKMRPTQALAPVGFFFIEEDSVRTQRE